MEAVILSKEDYQKLMNRLESLEEKLNAHSLYPELEEWADAKDIRRVIKLTRPTLDKLAKKGAIIKSKVLGKAVYNTNSVREYLFNNLIA